jgi:hypothetical protein
VALKFPGFRLSRPWVDCTGIANLDFSGFIFGKNPRTARSLVLLMDTVRFGCRGGENRISGFDQDLLADSGSWGSGIDDGFIGSRFQVDLLPATVGSRGWRGCDTLRTGGRLFPKCWSLLCLSALDGFGRKVANVISPDSGNTGVAVFEMFAQL